MVRMASITPGWAGDEASGSFLLVEHFLDPEGPA